MSSKFALRGSFGKKFLTVGCVTALVFSACVPAQAAESSESASWNVPTKASSVTTTVNGKEARYVTGASAVGGATASEYLGISIVRDSPRNTAFNSAINRTDAKEGNQDAAINVAGYQANPGLGIWGSDVNECADPYVANYFYNLYVEANSLGDELKSDDATIADTYPGMGNGTLVDDTDVYGDTGTCASLAKRPDVLVVRPSSITSFADQVKEINSFTSDSAYYKAKSSTYVGDENYNPVVGTYDCSSMYAITESLHKIADAANTAVSSAASQNVTLTTRYGDPEEVADDVEKIILGTQDYVLSKIADGTVKEKTVAFVQAIDGNDANATVTLVADVDPAVWFGGSTHLTEALTATTKNLANELNPDLAVEDKMHTVTCSVADLAKADVIMLNSVDNSWFDFSGVTEAKTTLKSNIQSALNAGGYVTADKGYAATDSRGQVVKSNGENVINMYTCNPRATTGLGQMQVDTLMLTPLITSYVYPEILNQAQMVAYYYQKAYHVKESSLKTAISMLCQDMTLANGVSLNDVDSYSAEKIEALLDEGLQYYANYSSDVLEDAPYLEPSSYFETPAKTTSKIKAVSTKASVAYTGSKKTPTVKVTDANGKTIPAYAYTVSYKNNKKVGTATVTVKGDGVSSTGTASTTFKINPAKATIKSAKAGTASIKVKTAEQDQTAGYQVACTTGKKTTKVTVKGAKLNTKVTGLKSGKTYTVKVRAYKKASGETYYGSWSDSVKVKVK